jgi:hypothetical protein
MNNFHVFQSPNKKNHKHIQKHKCKNSVQKHQHITTTRKTQAWQHNPRARQKRHLQTHMQHMPHVVHRTDETQFETTIPGAHQIYKKQWPPISICPTHPKQVTWIRTYPWHHDITETSQQNLTTNLVWATIHPIPPSTQTAHSRATCRWPKPNVSTDLWWSDHTTPCQAARPIAAPLPLHDSLPTSWDQPTSTTGRYKSQMNILHFLIYSQQPNVLWLNIATIHQWHNMYLHDMNLLSVSAHNSHQPCVCVVPPEDGQVMPETCRDVNLNKVKSEVCIKLVLLITKLRHDDTRSTKH